MKKKFELKTVIVIFVFILLALSVSRPALAQETVPDFYGYYILEGKQWVEIPKAVTMRETPLRGIGSMWGIWGLNTKPEMVVDDQRPTILVYEQGVNINKVQLIRLWYFEELRAIDFHGKPPDQGFFKNLCGVSWNSIHPLGLWTIVGTHSLRVGPVPNRPGMFRLRPEENLPPGVYAVYHGTQFTSRPIAGNLHILLRAFQIRGAETKLSEHPPLSPSPVEIISIVTAAAFDKSRGVRGIDSNFRVSTRQIVGYMEVGERRGGEVVDFIWLRPDGAIHVQTKNTLESMHRGRMQYVFSKFRPANLLMPGQWVLAVKIEGKLVRWIPFTVSIR